MRTILFLLVGIMITISGVSQTQQSVGGKLSFEEAVKIGLKNNFTLQQQKNTLHYTQLNKTASMMQLGPRVDASASAYRVDGNSFNQQRGEVVNGMVDFINGSVGASLPIFNGLNQVNQYRQAHSANEAQLHQVVRSSQDVIQTITNNYLTCLLDQELLNISEKNIETQKVQYEQIRSQVELGARAEADLYNQEYQVKNAELLYIRALNRLNNDLALLAQNLAIDPRTKLELEPVNWDINSLLQDSVYLDDMQELAIARRSDLKQAEYSEKAAHYGYSAMKGRYYPNLSAGVSYGSRFNYIHGIDNRSFDDQFRHDNRQLNYGLSLTIPIFYGFAYRSQTAQAKMLYRNAAVRRQSTEITVKTEVLQAYQNFQNAKTSYIAAQAQLRAAELTYQTQRERYHLGISNVVEMNTTNQAYVQAQGDYQSALYTLMFQRLLIDYAIGTLNVDAATN
jgi:outer membrane protein